jgi:hypothetical protein
MGIWDVADGKRGCWPFGVVNRVVQLKDVADRGHSSGEFAMSRGPLVSRTEGLATTRDK